MENIIYNVKYLNKNTDTKYSIKYGVFSLALTKQKKVVSAKEYADNCSKATYNKKTKAYSLSFTNETPDVYDIIVSDYGDVPEASVKVTKKIAAGTATAAKVTAGITAKPGQAIYIRRAAVGTTWSTPFVRVSAVPEYNG